jgi:hypothetical protein
MEAAGIGLQAGCGGRHVRGVEGAVDIQTQRPFGAGGFQRGRGGLRGLSGTGDHQLAGAVVIDGIDPVFARQLGRISSTVHPAAEDGIHRTLAGFGGHLPQRDQSSTSERTDGSSRTPAAPRALYSPRGKAAQAAGWLQVEASLKAAKPQTHARDAQLA